MLAATPAADALSLDAPRLEPSSPGHYGWGIRILCLAVTLAYLLAGIAKLRNSGFAFIDGDTLRNYVAFDNVRKAELGSVYSPLGAWLLPYPELFTGFAWLSLVLELGAPFALFHRRLGASWAVLVWGFHVGVLALMAIAFAYQLSGIGFACFFRVERLGGWIWARLRPFPAGPLRWWWTRHRSLGKASGALGVLQSLPSLHAPSLQGGLLLPRRASDRWPARVAIWASPLPCSNPRRIDLSRSFMGSLAPGPTGGAWHGASFDNGLPMGSPSGQCWSTFVCMANPRRSSLPTL